MFLVQYYIGADKAGENQDVFLYDAHVIHDNESDVGEVYLYDDPPSSWTENSPPLAQPDAVTTTVDQSVVIPVLDNDQDPDGDELSFARGIQPENGFTRLSSDGEQIEYIPDTDWVGTDTFPYWITDGHYESEPATVTVTVEAENQAPVAMTDTVTTTEETPVVVDVLANDSDPEGDTLSVTQVSSPTNGTATILADQTIEYSPTTDFNGADEFIYTVSDGEATAQGRVSVTVEAVNAAPVVHADAVTTTAETPVVITPLDNDHDPDGDPLTLTAVGAPAHGQAMRHPTTATITYTPTQDLDTVTLPYSDPFSYTISDGAHIVSGTISVTVTASQRTVFLPLVSRE